MSDAVDGRRLRTDWDAACDAAIDAARRGVDTATRRGEPHVAAYLNRQVPALRSVRAIADGRRAIPGSQGSGVLHDVPAELAEDAYADTMQPIDKVQELWYGSLGATDWDWNRGYPPTWPTRLGDRLRAGLLYRRK